MEQEKASALKREARRELCFRGGGDTLKRPLPPVKKNLYIECQEVKAMTEQQVAKFRKVNGDIKVRGQDCPKPILNWFQCGLPDPVLQMIETR